MQENKKAASDAANTTGSKGTNFIASVAQQGGEVKQRIMLLYPCDTCGKRCTSSSYSRCPAFGTWAKTSWRWATRLLKSEVRKP
ncbi:MAG TPA: hypothetical protein DC024_01705 [Clostridiales bacterium]|jgi:hypothetical protein|nr:hypothetical protein [Clostridiales bacterium]